MASLREKMAEHGFESNETYDYPLRCLLGYRPDVLRVLNVSGDPGRHKTAFANALARALDYEHLLYHDFTQAHDPLPLVLPPPSRDEDGREEPPIEAFDRVMSDACALSEAEPSIVILDQLQAADFREHIRLYQFIRSACWTFGDARFQANPRHLLLFLISEGSLYHSLHKASFRVWVSAASLGRTHYRPADFGLGPLAQALMDRLGDLFAELGVAPTRGEYARLLFDLQQHCHTAEQLCVSLFGWTQGVDRARLDAPATRKAIDRLMPVLEEFVGVDRVEITAPGE